MGREHPDYAASLQNLAVLYKNMGQYEKAEPLYLESKAIREKALGRENPAYAESLQNLAGLYQVMGKYEKAQLLLLEGSTVNMRLIEQALHHLSESELNNYLDKFSNSQNQTLLFTQIAGSKKMIPICYDNSLFYKGFLLQSIGRIKQLALSDEGTAEKYIRLKGYHRRLATQYAQPIAKRDSALVAQLEAKANDIEKDLARTVARWGLATKQVQWQQVQAALKPNEAAIEFVHYRFYQNKQTDSTLYAALVLLPAGAFSPAEVLTKEGAKEGFPGSEQPQFIPLFEEKQLAALLKTEGKPKADFYNNLYAAGAKGDALYNLIWKPLEGIFPRGTTVYFSPTGLLHRLHLAALPAPNGKTIGDQWPLVQVNSTRQLVFPSVASTSNTAVLYGGIQYDASPEIAMNEPVGNEMASLGRGLDFSQTDSTLRGDGWNYLRWTDVEVSAAAELLQKNGIQVSLKKGTAATEASLKALGSGGDTSPRVLHIATHGYFFPDPSLSPSLGGGGGGGLQNE